MKNANVLRLTWSGGFYGADLTIFGAVKRWAAVYKFEIGWKLSVERI